MLIAIDGPAGAGKSTVARALADRLGYTYLDSGAMYRCVALAALQAGGGSVSRLSDALGDLAGTVVIDFLANGTDGAPSRVLLDGRDVSEEIRTPEVSEAASLLATDPDVRAALVAKQRELIATGDWVAEGRDIGTVVAPDAELKIFLTASPKERARRRAIELDADPEALLIEQALRDERDSTLGRSTLQAAPDAVALDTTGLTLEQVVERIVGILAQC
ncbi:MAG TPA: (d)CMP kinase [Solirubrobacteraceae bacterium]|jgi:cytidylate kinase|nr:(d)CMP kinase [Solirubrobacteraceae bacterium]